LFRPRHRPEKNARSSAQRGSVGSARVWDERTRARHLTAPAPERPAAPPAPALDELVALIQGIVRVTLDTRLTELERPRRSALAAELERRLLEVFCRSAPPSDGPRAPAPLDAPPVTAPVEEASPSAAVVDEGPALATGSTPRSASQRALALVLEDRLARLGGPLATRPDLCRMLAELTITRLEPAQAAAEVGGELLQSLDVLARRERKLERALHDARAALAYVSGLEHVDAGIASIYRQVQGLAQDDPRREQKAGALVKIFQANLELRGRGEDS